MLSTHSRARGALCRSLAATLCLVAAPLVAWGAEPAPAGSVETGSDPATIAEPPATNNGKVALSVGSDFTTAYFFRGILQERDGFIWQPYGGVRHQARTRTSGTAFDRQHRLSIGTWNSIQSNADPVLGKRSGQLVRVRLSWSASRLGLCGASLSRTSSTSPTRTRTERSRRAGARLTIASTTASGSVRSRSSRRCSWAFEVDNTAIGYRSEGMYLELGVKPAVVIVEEAEYPLTLALP